MTRPNRLDWRACFRFPIATPEARRDVLIGACWLLLPLFGWILNLGHRLDVVHRLYHDNPPWFRGFSPWWSTFRRGLHAATAIAIYLSPAMLFGALAWWVHPTFLFGAVPAFLWAIFSLPGGMTWNAAFGDIRYLYRPDKAFRRALEGGRLYLQAWAIAMAAMSLSFLGLLALGVGFLVTSVWAWMVVGYAFSKALALAAEARASE